MRASPTFTAWPLFATTSVWPSPVPLLLLALGLGYLAYRAQSLAAPMLIHALFNGFNCVLILVTRPGG